MEVLDPGFGDPTETCMVIYLAGFGGGMADYLPEWEDKMDPGLVTLVKEGQKFTAPDMVKAQIARHEFYDRVRRYFDRFDLLLTPTLAVPAFKVGQLMPDPGEDDLRAMAAWTPFTYPFNLTGNPAATVPAGFTREGLPVGLQIVGRRFADLTVLQASAAFEQARPWADKRPSL